MAEVQAPETTEQAPEPTVEETKAQLTTLKNSATREYSLKNYAAAAELFSEATELQAELNGEMNPDNADLLYAYGRCLYHVAVSKSDVLGGKVAEDQEPAKKKRKTKATKNSDPAPAATTEEEKPGKAEDSVVEEKKDDPEAAASKPFFQITGDENWTDSEDEGEDAAEGEAEADEEEDDDFAIAYEILDVARVLLSRKLDSISQQHEGKGKAKETPPEQTPEGRSIVERLADTHDLQAEISLENERFSDAVSDSKSSLDLKLKIYPTESSLVAEAHYKLSLALEFAAITPAPAEGEAPATAEPATSQVDEDMRKEAVIHMERAIESCKLRVTKETQSLSSLSPEQAKEKERSIKDVTEMIGDMEQRLVDLRNPAAPADASVAMPDESMLGGILGSLLGETPAQQKSRIEEATKTANDLSGLIKKKKPKTEETKTDAAVPSAVVANGKRKAEDDVEGGEKSEKKVKFAEDAPAAAI